MIAMIPVFRTGDPLPFFAVPRAIRWAALAAEIADYFQCAQEAVSLHEDDDGVEVIAIDGAAAGSIGVYAE